MVGFYREINGFTLIELIFVIVIMSVLLAAVFITWPTLSVNLVGQAQQLANDIRYTQSLAMSKGQRYYLIKQSSNTYQIMNSSGAAVTNAMGSTTVTLNSGITFGTLTNLPNNLIAFDVNGTPYTTSSSPGTALTSTAAIPLVKGSSTSTVSISPYTGRVIVS